MQPSISLQAIDELEDRLVLDFRQHPVFAASREMRRDTILELLGQRRFLSLAFTPMYELALDALSDDRARQVVRSLISAEYDDGPTHRELLVLDLCAIGATRRQITCACPSPTTISVIEGLLAAMVCGPYTGDDVHQIAILSMLRLAGEVLVAVEYEALWPQLVRLGLSADGGPGTTRSEFYYPHMVHDTRTRRLADPSEYASHSAHSDLLTECLRAQLTLSSAAGFETCVRAMTNGQALKRSFYDPWLPR